MHTHHTRKWRSLALLASITAAVGVAAIAACNTDKTIAPAPSSPIKGQPTVSRYDADGGVPGPITYNGFPSAPAANPQLDAYNYCFAQLVAANWVGVSDQVQALVWDTTTNRPGGDTLFKARLRIRFRYWAGTYAYGTDPLKTLKCIRVDSVGTQRAAATDTAWGPYLTATYPIVKVIELEAAGQPKFELAIPSGGDVWCWGNDLSANPHGPSCTPANAASVLVRAVFPWGRRCDLTEDGPDNDLINPPSARRVDFQTGGMTGPNYTTWGGTPLSWVQQNGYTGDTNKWEVQLWAVDNLGRYGYWTVNNYGAGVSPHTDGWDGAPGSPMCNRYTSGTIYPTSYWKTKWRGGGAHYIQPFTPAAWP